RKIVDETRDVVVGRVFSRLGLNGEPSPILRLTVRGWIGYVEAASLDWLERRDTSREELRDLLVTSLVVLMGIAQDLGSRASSRTGS
ncbi:MAG: hypothetical protein M3O70_08660, partial [Actinomycetota bacterium]|nr:hypothetical protein [Actinomycetota bacterium]